MFSIDIGGYESQLTFWGYNTSQIVRNGLLNAQWNILYEMGTLLIGTSC
jgi:hypothetical protein